MSPLDATQLLAYGTMIVASAVLFGYLIRYVRAVLSDVYRHGWWYLATALLAGALYGGFGILSELAGRGIFAVLSSGSTLFLFLFLALGIRAMYFMGDTEPRLPWTLRRGVDYGVIGFFVVSWWTGFFLHQTAWTGLVELGGWVVACVWAQYYAVHTVQRHEGTSLAAMTRYLLPAVLYLTLVVTVELLHRVTGAFSVWVRASWIVGMVLVAGSLFNTAIAIRQQDAELHRMYDRTTWRTPDYD